MMNPMDTIENLITRAQTAGLYSFFFFFFLSFYVKQCHINVVL